MMKKYKVTLVWTNTEGIECGREIYNIEETSLSGLKLRIKHIVKQKVSSNDAIGAHVTPIVKPYFENESPDKTISIQIPLQLYTKIVETILNKQIDTEPTAYVVDAIEAYIQG